MFLSLFWSYCPIVLAPLAALLLALLLQRLLRYPRMRSTSATTSTGTDLVPAAPAPTAKLTWEDVTAHHNRFVTVVVPVFASGVMLESGVWRRLKQAAYRVGMGLFGVQPTEEYATYVERYRC